MCFFLLILKKSLVHVYYTSYDKRLEDFKIRRSNLLLSFFFAFWCNSVINEENVKHLMKTRIHYSMYTIFFLNFFNLGVFYSKSLYRVTECFVL